ncbi:MAG: TetR family transcriptional regulator [Rhodospirillum sp.]|nr:TetR family transcriptional regulator [Rhodospirillum sp.]MCF8491439.1 TetR family transcriptional regulator [Rhodospirillum sp.]MCF8500933.1 TetR family transcriptional regulator [Rhodospirillum sp.]
MARPRKIDRDKVLDAAEAVVAEVGAAALSLDAVAKVAGVTKSGVQYCFGTKQQLIDAMFQRWELDFDREVTGLAGPDPDPITLLRGHIEATMRTDEIENARSAVLMAALLQAPEHRQRAQEWFRQRMDGLDVSTEVGRRTRLAFLASEGLFILRCFGLMAVSESEWESTYRDILDFQASEPASPGGHAADRDGT